jgi:thioredoxin 1
VNILKTNKMVEIKKFEADWCGPCRMLKPTFEKLEKTFGDSVKFSYINVDENSEEAQKYGVRNIPLVVVEKNGEEIDRLVGVQSEQVYETSLTKLL